MDVVRPAPRLRFARLRMSDAALARALFADLLGWSMSEARGRRLFRGPGLDVEVTTAAAADGPAGPDLLGWQVPDLLDWQRHCHRQGLSVTDEGLLGPDSALQLAAEDTGGCVLEFSERHDAHGIATPAAVGVPARARARPLAAIDLRVRAPERVAAHWSRLLALPAVRQEGLPAVATACGALRFMPAAEHADAGIDGLWMRPEEAGALQTWTHQLGLQPPPAGPWRIGGLTLRCT
ncbi:MAG: hypothetical protein ACLGJD_05640 [Gammaproteobacteria bacterium]|uniref:hypothetical protein n=1 Tax=Pseudacidovorax sp. TaxID=1934311 RepID=UPI001B701B8F|nr:hypothetical protein [Pseudacidovorax sp.]MBP6895617.1 hypothetical protein [Pseudacidovorax sp.]